MKNQNQRLGLHMWHRLVISVFLLFGAGAHADLAARRFERERCVAAGAGKHVAHFTLSLRHQYEVESDELRVP